MGYNDQSEYPRSPNRFDLDPEPVAIDGGGVTGKGVRVAGGTITNANATTAVVDFTNFDASVVYATYRVPQDANVKIEPFYANDGLEAALIAGTGSDVVVNINVWSASNT